MANPTEHISIRIPVDVMVALRREALEVERSVSWVIVRKLSGRGVEDHAATCAGRHGNGAPSGSQSAYSRPETQAGPQQESSPAAPTNKSCPDCGALNGHQKWCKR